jgi:hypothetical protein
MCGSLGFNPIARLTKLRSELVVLLPFKVGEQILEDPAQAAPLRDSDDLAPAGIGPISELNMKPPDNMRFTGPRRTHYRDDDAPIRAVGQEVFKELVFVDAKALISHVPYTPLSELHGLVNCQHHRFA